jgi:hypothetical protein
MKGDCKGFADGLHKLRLGALWVGRRVFSVHFCFKILLFGDQGGWRGLGTVDSIQDGGWSLCCSGKFFQSLSIRKPEDYSSKVDILFTCLVELWT